MTLKTIGLHSVEIPRLVLELKSFKLSLFGLKLSMMLDGKFNAMSVKIAWQILGFLVF